VAPTDTQKFVFVFVSGFRPLGFSGLTTRCCKKSMDRSLGSVQLAFPYELVRIDSHTRARIALKVHICTKTSQ
jgi:hypothetical protein